MNNPANYKMVDVDQLDVDLTRIADAIREPTNTPYTDTLLFPDDFISAPAKLVEFGKKEQYDEFWDNYQANGNRNYYRYAFDRSYWNDQNFKPKYDIKPSSDGQYIFQQCSITNLKAILERQGVKLDFSRTPSLYYAFNASTITHLPELNCANSTSFQNTFFRCYNLVSIDKLIVSEKSANQGFARGFDECSALEHVIFEGVIPVSISLQWSPLSVASMKSIISCLKNYSGTASEYVYEIKFSDDRWAALEADNTAPNGSTWAEYVSSIGWNT